jgi:hypothetical protein
MMQTAMAFQPAQYKQAVIPNLVEEKIIHPLYCDFDPPWPVLETLLPSACLLTGKGGILPKERQAEGRVCP